MDTLDGLVTIMVENERGFIKPLVIDGKIATFANDTLAKKWMGL